MKHLTNIQSTKIIFVCNLVFGIIGMGTFYYLWGMASISTMITCIYLIRSFHFTTNKALCIASIVMGFFTAIAGMIGWIILLYYLSNPAKDYDGFYSAMTFTITAPIVYVTWMAYIILSSISLWKMKNHLEEKDIYQILEKELY